MKVLITGAAGFIGSHIADALLAEGHHVTGIDNLSTGRTDNWHGPEDLIVGDIADSVPDNDPDVIYHCAASYRDRDDWEGDARTNVLGTIKVVRLAQRTGAKIVYFQTSLCYGPRTIPALPTSPVDPHGSYAITKTAAEQFIIDSGVPYVSLRLANMYGPRNLSGPVPTFYKRLSAGESCYVVDARRDYVYVADLVGLAVKCLVDGQGVYHASSGTDNTIGGLWLQVVAAMGLVVPPPIYTPRGDDDVARLLIDPSDTQRDFGWQASTSLQQGIKAAVDWYAAHGVTETFTHLGARG